MFDIVLFAAELHQFGILIHHDELMFDRDRRHLDAQHLRGALRMVAAGGDHMFRGDDDLFVGGHEVPALFDHLGTGDLPGLAVPVEGIGLPLPLDRHAALPRALGHRHGHIRRVNVAVGLVVERTLEVFGTDQRPFRLDLFGRQPFVRHAACLGGRRIEHVFIHALIRLGHAQVAHHGKARVQPGFFLEGLVELDGIVVDMRRGIGHVEIGQQTGRMPCGAGGEFVPLQQHDIFPARTRQMIGDRRTDRAPAHDERLDLRFHFPTPCKQLAPF